MNNTLDSLSLVSWNVRGLGHPIKRGKVFAHLRSLKSDIIFLQETHVQATQHRMLRANWISQVYQSPFTSKARGVAILFRKSVPFHFHSCITDPNGRFIILSGDINSFPIILVNIYGPNTDDPAFFRKVFDLIPDDDSSHILIGGDFNCYLDPYLDRFSSAPPPKILAVQTLNNLMKSKKVVDVWRLQHPSDRDYSFYSHVHRSYTRIDYFLVDSRLISNIDHTKYHSIIISDHSPITLKLQLSLPRQAYSWRFNPFLLTDQAFKEYITLHISQFLEINDNGEVNDSILWETLKVYIRGQIIAYEATLKRSRRGRLDVIERELLAAEQAYKTSLLQTDYNNILKLKYEYNSILGEQVGKTLLKLKHRHFELGDKPQRLLARQLKGEQAKRAIYKIKSKSGLMLTDLKDINRRFREFYSEIYTSKSTATQADFDQFFDSLQFPQLDDAFKENLDLDFTLSELQDAIKAFPTGRAAGPDGFGPEFYKAFHDLLAPILLRMIQDTFKNKRLPSTLSEANICVLLKKDKDETDPGSYRPIALLNYDLKIITKVLANRLGKHIASIIHPDQTGFIPGRYSFCNVRKILNILYATYGKNDRAAMLSLDAHKAFDMIEWPYLIATLRRFGFGETFIEWVKILYSDPKSFILTNGDKSSPFSLQCGVRQGDPLSPLLFDIALEPLALGIRGHPGIKGIRLGDIETRVTLYADDLLICLTDPAVSIPTLLDYINSFGKISGYTINWQKSEFMPLVDHFTEDFLGRLPFRVVKDRFSYLGLKLTRNSEHLFRLNFTEALEKLSANIESWRTLPLSMIGRVNAVKMVSLPRFLYLFQNLPVYLNASFFKKLESIILPFVWGYKSHRIAKAHLHKPLDKGGLGLPIFKHYYWAANSRALTYWKGGGGLIDGSPLWLQLEASAARDFSLPALLFSGSAPVDKSIRQNFTLKHSLRILDQIKVACQIPNVSIHAPICQNHSFKPGLLDGVFGVWRERGIKTFLDLYIDGKFASFTDLRTKFNLPNSHFFRYLQVRHYVKENCPQFESTPTTHPFLENLLLPPDSKQLVSKFVTCFTTAIPSDHIRDAWASDLNSEISQEFWEEAMSQVHSCSINSRYRLIQYKVIHRLHYSKTKLNRIFPSVSPVCDKCSSAEGSLAHLFWFCPTLHSFWTAIFEWLSLAYSTDIQPNHDLAIFGCSVTTTHLPRNVQMAWRTGMVVARKLILLTWKSTTPPCFAHWLREMLSVIQMEKLCMHKPNAQNRFQKTWGPFLAHCHIT